VSEFIEVPTAVRAPLDALGGMGRGHPIFYLIEVIFNVKDERQ
jgi:hypothetical protein